MRAHEEVVRLAVDGAEVGVHVPAEARLELEVRREPVGDHEQRHEQEHDVADAGARRGPAPAGAGAGTGGWRRAAPTANTCQGNQPTPQGLRGASARRTPPPGPASTGQRHERRGARTRGARSSRSSSRARTDPTRSATHTPHGGGQEEHEQRGEHRREVEELVGAVERQHGVEREPDHHPEVPGAAERAAATGSTARSPRSPTITAHCDAGRAVELERRRGPTESVDSSEVEGGAAHRPVEERRVELGERGEEVEAEQARAERPGGTGRPGRWRRPTGAGPRRPPPRAAGRGRRAPPAASGCRAPAPRTTS